MATNRASTDLAPLRGLLLQQQPFSHRTTHCKRYYPSLFTLPSSLFTIRQPLSIIHHPSFHDIHVSMRTAEDSQSLHSTNSLPRHHSSSQSIPTSPSLLVNMPNLSADQQERRREKKRLRGVHNYIVSIKYFIKYPLSKLIARKLQNIKIQKQIVS